MQRQVIAWHHATTEKVAAHPVSVTVYLECIGHVTMAEYMHEKKPAGLQPVVYAFEQGPVIAHVFEHFNRNDAIVFLLAHQVIHVAGLYANIVQLHLPSQFLDVPALGM